MSARGSATAETALERPELGSADRKVLLLRGLFTSIVRPIQAPWGAFEAYMCFPVLT